MPQLGQSKDSSDIIDIRSRIELMLIKPNILPFAILKIKNQTYLWTFIDKNTLKIIVVVIKKN